jgi:hypothetical protein
MNGTNMDKSAALTFRINQTNDGQPPKNVIIHIHGCNFGTAATKAQVESTGTSTIAGEFISLKKYFFS